MMRKARSLSLAYLRARRKASAASGSLPKTPKEVLEKVPENLKKTTKDTIFTR
jgi:hypothetical protein